ncbi:MAG TPA: TRAM domain-containing protein [Nitrososphaeraceae archaeon]|nr:TRAM domain-containing protein [Nitrososphaeraceae archaeon]
MENRDSHANGQRGGYGGGGGYRSERGYGGRGHGGFGGGFGGPRPFRPSPVKVGEEFDVKIESMSKRGDAGVAKVEGLVIFVAGTKVGDNVRIRITKVGRGYATADIASQPESTSQPESADASIESDKGTTPAEE